MGEVADLVLGGILCQTCGTFISPVDVGFPRDCIDCIKEEDEE